MFQLVHVFRDFVETLWQQKKRNMVGQQDADVCPESPTEKPLHRETVLPSGAMGNVCFCECLSRDKGFWPQMSSFKKRVGWCLICLQGLPGLLWTVDWHIMGTPIN